MPRERPLKLDRYGISRTRYYELKYYCRQYPEWKAKLSEIRAGAYKPINLSGLPSGSGGHDSVSEIAVKAAELSGKCEVIEQCCIAAAHGEAHLYNALLKNVTEGIAYEYMPSYMGRSQFYAARRKFFILLDKRK